MAARERAQPRVRCRPAGDRPALYVYGSGTRKYAPVMARLDHANDRTEYQVALQTSRDRGTVHRAYWWPRPGLRPAHSSTCEPTDREPIPTTTPG
ncbi:hypothetical protein ACH4OW_37985 [Streptomyces sp. NPDC017056]|uniref:hypothetical protein n=1 Tax=Streptomyces sp. NPDC017056 TaxID=3364973 RepID=UPI0037BCF00F